VADSELEQISIELKEDSMNVDSALSGLACNGTYPVNHATTDGKLTAAETCLHMGI